MASIADRRTLDLLAMLRASESRAALQADTYRFRDSRDHLIQRIGAGSSDSKRLFLGLFGNVTLVAPALGV